MFQIFEKTRILDVNRLHKQIPLITVCYTSMALNLCLSTSTYFAYSPFFVLSCSHSNVTYFRDEVCFKIKIYLCLKFYLRVIIIHSSSLQSWWFVHYKVNFAEHKRLMATIVLCKYFNLAVAKTGAAEV